MQTLFLYHDFASPFCRLALEVAADVADRLGLALRAVPWELNPAPEPLPPADHPELRAAVEAAGPLARELGVALRPPPLLPRTHKAHEAVAHARGGGGELALLRALYDGLWGAGADIGRIDVIAELAEAAGLDREPLHVALGVDEHRAEVAAAQAAALAAGVTGVPAFGVGRRLLVGLVGPAELEAWIREAPGGDAGMGAGEASEATPDDGPG